MPCPPVLRRLASGHTASVPVQASSACAWPSCWLQVTEWAMILDASSPKPTAAAYPRCWREVRMVAARVQPSAGVIRCVRSRNRGVVRPVSQMAREALQRDLACAHHIPGGLPLRHPDVPRWGHADGGRGRAGCDQSIATPQCLSPGWVGCHRARGRARRHATCPAAVGPCRADGHQSAGPGSKHVPPAMSHVRRGGWGKNAAPGKGSWHVTATVNLAI
jgi:hypothetical protein